MTDSTIAPPPPKTSDFFNERFAAAQDDERCYENHTFIFSLFAKVCRPMTSGWQGTPCFSSYSRGLISKPAISLKKSWGGYRKSTPFFFSSSISLYLVYPGHGLENIEIFCSVYPKSPNWLLAPHVRSFMEKNGVEGGGGKGARATIVKGEFFP